ncbi:MAG: porin family protein [Bacteroidaceae bacterium]|nr:porin family protein [Bacteroidaceae bacterium]
MKKVFLTLALVLTTVVASAQWYVGGGLGVGFDKHEDAKTTTFKIKPEVGYKINDNFAVGAILGFDWVKPSEGDALKTLSVEAYARYTFLRSGDFSIFADGAVGYEKKDDAKAYTVGIKPGVAYNINEKWTVAAHLGQLGYTKYDETSKFGIELGDALSFGVYYNF